MNYKFFFLLLSLTIAIGCNNTNKKESAENGSNQKPLISKSSQEDFDGFFTKFRSDSAFKISRINFPLKGFNSDEREIDSEQSSYLWDKENFIFYSDEDFKNQNTTDTIIEDITKKDSSVIYRRYKKDSGYDINYKFNIVNGKWYLTDYSYKNF